MLHTLAEGTQTVVDIDRLKVVTQIPTSPGPAQIGIEPNQKYAYVATYGHGIVDKIDLLKNKVIKTIPIAPNAGTHGIAFVNNGELLLVTNTGTNTISVIDTQHDIILKNIKVASSPEGIAVK